MQQIRLSNKASLGAVQTNQSQSRLGASRSATKLLLIGSKKRFQHGSASETEDAHRFDLHEEGTADTLEADTPGVPESPEGAPRSTIGNKFTAELSHRVAETAGPAAALNRATRRRTSAIKKYQSIPGMTLSEWERRQSASRVQ